MRSDQYTADAICRSMGLDAFEPAGPAPSLRVILKPSFHPEVCITVYTSIEERSEISVIALKEMVWRQCVVHRLQSVQESTTVPSEDFIGAFEGYEISQSSDTCTDRSIRIDGMGIDCCLLSAHGIHRRYVNVHGPTIETFIGHLVWLAWIACRKPGVRNALADCAVYLGNKYSQETDLDEPPLRQMLILGEPDSRAEFIATLNDRTPPEHRFEPA